MSERKNTEKYRKRIQNLITGGESSKRSRIITTSTNTITPATTANTTTPAITSDTTTPAITSDTTTPAITSDVTTPAITSDTTTPATTSDTTTPATTSDTTTPATTANTTIPVTSANTTTPAAPIIKRWIPGNQRIEERLDRIEEKIDDLRKFIEEKCFEVAGTANTSVLNTSVNEVDEEFINDVIKNVVKLVMKCSIYPSKEELRGATEGYLIENHHEFFEKFSEVRWTSFYNKNVHQNLVKKQRSARGSLTSRAKEAMFSLFGENVLPSIKNNSTPSEISNWKKNEQVAECYENLFKPISENSQQLTMSRIIEKVFPQEELPPNVQIAYVIAVCTTMLSPRYEKIIVNEKTIKNKMARFLEKLDANESVAAEDCISSSEGEDSENEGGEE